MEREEIMSADKQDIDNLLWRLHIPNRYSAVAYLSSEFIGGRAVPICVVLDKATYGLEGVEDEEGSFWVNVRS